MAAPEIGYRNLSHKRSIELDALECLEIRDVLYGEAARLDEEARSYKPRLARRRLIEAHADRLRRTAEKFYE